MPLQRLSLLLLTCFLYAVSLCQDSSSIGVHFIYGSKPLKAYKATEKKWFGAMYGGHVGIESNRNEFLSFNLVGRCHWFDHNNHKHSIYKLMPPKAFWDIMGTSGDSVQKLSIVIPVTAAQKKLFDSIAVAYLQETPYDYSLVGMRCASATYEVLAQLNIVKEYGFRRTCFTILYPKILRKRLIRMAEKNGWMMIRQEGSVTRRWEKDA